MEFIKSWIKINRREVRPVILEGIIGTEIAFYQGVGAKSLRKKTMVHRYKVLIFMFLKKDQSQSFETKLPWIFLIKAQG